MNLIDEITSLNHRIAYISSLEPGEDMPAAARDEIVRTLSASRDTLSDAYRAWQRNCLGVRDPELAVRRHEEQEAESVRHLKSL